MKALVTGASSGIGSEIAVLLAKRGVKVVLVSRSLDALIEVSRQCPEATIFPCDLSVPVAVEELFTVHPEVDILVNCAGFTQVGNFAERDWTDARSVIEVNAIAVARLCHHYLVRMRKQGRGRILNIASSAALAAAPGYAIYAASKAFVLEFSHSLAAELEGTGVSVSCLIPGPTRTQFCRRAGLRESQSAMEPKAVARYALQLMERGLPTGTPGVANKLKQMLKRVLPIGLWSYVARLHMRERMTHANS